MTNAAQLVRWGTLSLAIFLAACGDGGGDDGSDAGSAGGAGAAIGANAVPAIANAVPTITGTPSTMVTHGASYLFTPNAVDPDGDNLEFGINSKPEWAEFDPKSGQLKGTPRATDVGTYSGIVIWVFDGTTKTNLPMFDLVVEPSAPLNRAPLLSGTPANTVVAGGAYTFVPKASDADGDALVFSIANRPVWATFDTKTGKLDGNPQIAHTGTYAGVAISVSDGTDVAKLAPFTIVVSQPATNRAPTISGTPPTTVEAGSNYTFTPTANDPDGQALVFSATGVPSWAGFDSRTGRIAGTPPTGASGATAPIVIQVSDGKSTAKLAAFSIDVTAPTKNSAPTISGTPDAVATVGTQYAFQPAAADADDDVLKFSIANRPSWATFNANTGRLQGTPTASNVLTYSDIVISVSDGKASATLAEFSIKVESPNAAPVIAGTPPASATVGTQYTFTPAATDADGDTLTYGITNKPAWAAFNTATGKLSGTPASTHVGTTAGIVISASDGKLSAKLASFAITVNAAPNKAPIISGTPSKSILPGSAYSFVPTASDGDADTLTFSITNKPSWATFSSATGKLSGTPTVADVGTTSGIVISVSDGKTKTSIAAFDLVVQAFATGSARLSWMPPTQNADGTPLSNLAGYRIYWGTSQGSYSNSVTLSNPGLTSYVVEGLVPGTYYFTAKTLNTSGVESSVAGQIRKTIL